MTGSRLAGILIAVLLVAVHGAGPVQAEGTAGLAGRWTLSRELSEFPRELGFGMDLVPVGSSSQPPNSGGRRGQRRGSAGPSNGAVSAFASGRESPDDVKRLQQLTDEVRNPSTHFTI